MITSWFVSLATGDSCSTRDASHLQGSSYQPIPDDSGNGAGEPIYQHFLKQWHSHGVNIPWNNVGSKKSIPLLLDNFPNESPQFNVRAYLVSCLASACFNQLPSHLRLGCRDPRATSHCHAIHLPDPQHAPSGRLPVRWPAGKLTVSYWKWP
jgi:hypothetical protein